MKLFLRSSLIVFHIISVWTASSRFITQLPDIGPLCQSQDGGMFGYSVALSQPNNTESLTWMAVGKPWDQSVHLYVAKTDILNNQTFNSTSKAQLEWVSAGVVQDQPQNFPRRGYSLFGYSVSLSRDGKYLAVKIINALLTY
jgi:hypothetical protein